MSADAPTVWLVRVARRATADIQNGWQHLADTAGEEIADGWQDGLNTVLAGLATMPERFAIAEPESALLGFPARRALYRRTKIGPAYLIYFRLVENALDAPTVFVFHVRHGAQEPLGNEEADVVARSLDD